MRLIVINRLTALLCTVLYCSCIAWRLEIYHCMGYFYGAFCPWQIPVIAAFIVWKGKVW